MKIKISITLSETVLTAIDRNMGEFKSRSDFIEPAARDYLRQLARLERERKDRDILDRRAEALNKEAEEVLAFQVAS